MPVEGFTSHYHVNRLLYFEEFVEVVEAIKREKQIKNWTRTKKLALVREMNPKFVNLAEKSRR